MLSLIALYIYAYLIGSVPTAYIIGRLVKGIDIRQYGSGNVGGSNVFYHIGKWWIVPLGLFELLGKGASPIWLARYALDQPLSFYQMAGLGLAAISGHNWSPWLGFKGGRGVSVAIGVMFALAWKELVFFIAVAGGAWLLLRSSGVVIYITLLLLPFWSLLIREPLSITWFQVGVIGLITIKRLIANLEPLPPGVGLRRGLWNRLWLDRDIHTRKDWVYRSPNESSKNSTKTVNKA